MIVNLYTTHCPKCEILKKKLDAKKIKYETITDKNEILKLGYTTAPLLRVDGKIMEFSEANTWINTY